MDLFIEMGPPMSESKVKESQSCAAPPIFANLTSVETTSVVTLTDDGGAAAVRVSVSPLKA